MNRATRKSLLAIGAVLVASYPGIAWLTGVLAEQRIQHSEEEELKRTPYVTLINREYRRGVYRSTELVTYEIRGPFAAAIRGSSRAVGRPTLRFTLRSVIHHGPLPDFHTVALATIDSTVSFSADVQRSVSRALGSKPILQAHSSIGWLGKVATVLTSPPANLRPPDGSTLEWQGMTARMTRGRDSRSWSGQLTLPRLAIESANGVRLEIAGLRASWSGKQVFGIMGIGRSSLTIDRVDGNGPRPGSGYFLRHATFHSEIKARGDCLDIRVDAALGAAHFGAVSLTDAVYSEDFQHLHGPSLASFAKALGNTEHDASASPAQLQEAVRDAVVRYGPGVLLHDPVMDIQELGFTMPDGVFRLSARISVPGLSPADLHGPALLPALKAHAQIMVDLRLDNTLLQKLVAMRGSSAHDAVQIANLERQGYLLSSPTAITTHLVYSTGRLTLNGHSFPPLQAR